MKLLRKILESKMLYLLHVKNALFGTFKNVYYSQTGEDVILRQIFKSKPKGFYVDVGAYHPVHYSNTKLLFDRGWTGINIDPNPDTIKIFNWMRPRDVNVNVGVALVRSLLTYFHFSHPSCNTFSQEVADQQQKKDWLTLIKTSTIECLPLREILHTHVPKDVTIDLLSVDVEGFDLDVLDSNDWDTYIPTVVVVEGHGFTLEKAHEYPIYTYLVEKGYTFYAFTGLSLVFKREVIV